VKPTPIKKLGKKLNQGDIDKLVAKLTREPKAKN
jgi:hypothetical protein